MQLFLQCVVMTFQKMHSNAMKGKLSPCALEFSFLPEREKIFVASAETVLLIVDVSPTTMTERFYAAT
jgi:hypothetical protein